MTTTTIQLPKFLMLHLLTQYPASLINRDDTGLAKGLPMGGERRTRISSQCQKKHWRDQMDETEQKLAELPKSINSRETFEKLIAQKLIAEGRYPEKVIREVGAALMGVVLGESPKAKKEKAKKDAADKEAGKEKEVDNGPSLLTSQIVAIGVPEIDYLVELVRVICSKVGDQNPADTAAAYFKTEGKNLRANLNSLKLGCGLRSAMMGRMVTSDVLSRKDAAIHVAHALTVHGGQPEADYFSALDGLASTEDKAVSGHLNATELSTGLYYIHATIDVGLLISNVTGIPLDRVWDKPVDRDVAAEVAAAMVRLTATVSPGAKKGSTAPYSYASLVLAELGDDQPRQLSEAFLQPVSLKGNVKTNAYNALANYVSGLDEMYGTTFTRAMSVIDATPDLLKIAPRTNLKALQDWVKLSIVQGSVLTPPAPLPAPGVASSTAGASAHG